MRNTSVRFNTTLVDFTSVNNSEAGALQDTQRTEKLKYFKVLWSFMSVSCLVDFLEKAMEC